MSSIIRTSRSQGPSLARRQQAANLDCAHEEAARIIESAHEQAGHEIAAAKAEAARLRSEAEDFVREQRQATMRDREHQLREQSNAAQQLMGSIVGELASQRQQVINELQSESVELALAIAERILRRELEADPSVVTELVRESLAMIDKQRRITICIHPDDLREFGNALEQMLRSCEVPHRVIGDEFLTRGGCRIETEQGMIDQSIETQLRRITEELLNVG